MRTPKPTTSNPPPSLLDSIRVGTPCSASWEAMRGDDRKRFCGDCRLHVYDLSAMRRDEAEDLLRSRGGRLCVRFTRRPDGRVATDDCGRVRRAIRRRARAVRAAVAGLFAMFFPLAAAGCGGPPSSGGGEVPAMGTPVAVPVPGDPGPEMGDYAPPPEMGRRVMGEVDVPPPRQGTTSPAAPGEAPPGGAR